MSARLVVVGRGAPERGGIPSFMHMLETGAADLGRPVTVVNLTPAGPVSGGASSWANLWRTLTDTWRVLREVRRGDVMHLHSALAPTVTALRAGLLLLAARLRGARTVVHAHGGRIAMDPPTGRARWLTARALRPADLVIAVSTGVRQTLVELGLAEAHVVHVPNGVDVERYVETSGGHQPPRVLYVGGLTPRKGVLDLFEASEKLRADGVEHELWLVGGVPDEGAEARRRIDEAAPEDARFLGQRDPSEMPAVYAEGDVFCLPSWWEAMPLTVLEAQASGLPVVATAVGDVPAMVEDGRTGFVVPPRDVEALADALGALLRDAGRRRAMSRAARELAMTRDQRLTLQTLGELFATLEEDR